MKGPLWEFFFSSPRPWHTVAAVLLVAAREVFVCSCCAADCEGVGVRVVRRGRFTSGRGLFEEVVMERCPRSCRDCPCRGRTQSSSTLMYAQLRALELIGVQCVWFWSLCVLRLCRMRVSSKVGGLTTCRVHSLCSWKVGEGRTASERAVEP